VKRSDYEGKRTFTIHRNDAGTEAFSDKYVDWLEHNLEFYAGMKEGVSILEQQLAEARAAAQHYFGMQTYFGLIESDHDWIEKCPWLEVWRVKEVTKDE
jgi:hypothetical protein